MNALTVGEASELLAALTLGSCDAAELAAVEAVLRGNPALAAEADRLTEAAGLLGLIAVREPPLELRRSVLTPSAPVGLFASVSSSFEGLLSTLPLAGWGHPLQADWSRHDVSGWTAREVVAHLAAIDEHFADQLDGAPPADVEHLIDAAVEASGTLTPPQLLKRRAEAQIRVVRGVRRNPETTVGWLGANIPARVAIIERSFETWLHANDLRRGLRLAEAHPSGDHLWLMCDLGATFLPAALAQAGFEHEGWLQLELDGPGGGRWPISLGSDTGQPPSGGEIGVLTAYSVDLCLLMGDRIPPERFLYRVTGGGPAQEAAAALVGAAPAFSHR